MGTVTSVSHKLFIFLDRTNLKKAIYFYLIFETEELLLKLILIYAETFYYLIYQINKYVPHLHQIFWICAYYNDKKLNILSDGSSKIKTYVFVLDFLYFAKEYILPLYIHKNFFYDFCFTDVIFLTGSIQYSSKNLYTFKTLVVLLDWLIEVVRRFDNSWVQSTCYES